MPTPKNGLQILNLHLKKHIFKKKKTFFLMYFCLSNSQLAITVGLMMTKLGCILFSRYGQTDMISELSHGNMSAHKNFQLKAQNYELAVNRDIHPQMKVRHKYFSSYPTLRWSTNAFVRLVLACNASLRQRSAKTKIFNSAISN